MDYSFPKKSLSRPHGWYQMQTASPYAMLEESNLSYIDKFMLVACVPISSPYLIENHRPKLKSDHMTGDMDVARLTVHNQRKSVKQVLSLCPVKSEATPTQ